MQLPETDRAYDTKKGMMNAIKHLMGGRVAELLTRDDISTGASNDIQRATDIAREMVTRYGFSEKLGPVNYATSEEVFLGNDFSSKKSYSEEVAAEIDHEIRRIVDEAFEETKKIITENMDKLEHVAKALLEVETLDGEQFEALYTGEKTAEDIAREFHEKIEEIQRENAREAQETQRIRREEEARMAELKRIEEEAEKGSYKTEMGTYVFGAPLIPTEDEVKKEEKAEEGLEKEVESNVNSEEVDEDDR